MDDADAPSDLRDVFRHNGIILHYFTTDAIGDLLTTNSGGLYSVTYPMVEKAGFGGTSRRLVAFIHKVNKADPYDNYVLNAAELSFDEIDGIKSIDDGQRTTDDESIYDLSGRRITAEAASSRSTLHTSLKKGIYIIGGRKVIIK